MNLSIVIPALNEAAKIGRDLEAACEFLTFHNMTGEVIVVDEGSTDDTVALAQAVSLPDSVTRTVIESGRRYGKGHAVRSGMAVTQGDYAMFADSGLCVPFADSVAGLDMIRAGTCDLAHGSRYLPQSVHARDRKIVRRLISKVFRSAFAPAMHFPHGITDSQCGFKVYRGDVARELYAACLTDGFMFDAEVILRARQQGYVIREFPVQWTPDHDSRLRPLTAVLDSLRELWHIKQALREKSGA